jgi:hypothetical protein
MTFGDQLHRRRPALVAGLALIAILTGGCLAEGPDPVRPSGDPPGTDRPGPSAPSQSATTSAIPRPSPSPIPGIEERGPAFEPVQSGESSVDVDLGVHRAVSEVDGVRITIETARNPLIAGRAGWITTTLTNTGRDVLHWMTDGCSIHVSVFGEMPFRWAGGFTQRGAAKTYKDWAYVANLPGLDSPIQLGTVPEPFIDQGEFGCADVGVPHVLAPGGRLRERHRWDGTAAPGLGLPPSGPAEWTGTFQLWGRDSEPGAARLEFTRDPIVVRLPVEIRSARDPRALSAGQAIDVALLVPAFRALLEATPSIQDWDMPITSRFDVPTGAWQIGLKTNKGRSVVVFVEGDTARVVDVVER